MAGAREALMLATRALPLLLLAALTACSVEAPRTRGGEEGPAHDPVMSAAIEGLSKDATIIERLESFGIESTTTTPEQMAAIIKAELPVYTEAVKAAGLLK